MSKTGHPMDNALVAIAPIDNNDFTQYVSLSIFAVIQHPRLVCWHWRTQQWSRKVQLYWLPIGVNVYGIHNEMNWNLHSSQEIISLIVMVVCHLSLSPSSSCSLIPLVSESLRRISSRLEAAVLQQHLVFTISSWTGKSPFLSPNSPQTNWEFCFQSSFIFISTNSLWHDRTIV